MLLILLLGAFLTRRQSHVIEHPQPTNSPITQTAEEQPLSPPVVVPVNQVYSHDRFVTLPQDIRRDFAAFAVGFDGPDDDDGDGVGDRLAVPQWVAYEMRRIGKKLSRGSERPREWATDMLLLGEGIVPSDASYRNSGYSRGHMCMKQIGFRLGAEADRETHTMFNACPQEQDFNEGIWLDLEMKTIEWAEQFGQIWVICGPVFTEKKASKWIGDGAEVRVAVPDGFYKIVVKARGDGAEWTVLAFMYPHDVAKDPKKEFDQTRYLVSVDSVEMATGLDFLSGMEDGVEEELERGVAVGVW